MRRSASEIIRNLEQRIARLERQAGKTTRQANTRRTAKVDLDFVGLYGMVQVDAMGGGDGLYIITLAPGYVKHEMKKTGLVIDDEFSGAYGFEIISVDHEVSNERAIQDWFNGAEYFDQIESGHKGATNVMKAKARHYSKIMDQLNSDLAL